MGPDREEYTHCQCIDCCRVFFVGKSLDDAGIRPKNVAELTTMSINDLMQHIVKISEVVHDKSDILIDLDDSMHQIVTINPTELSYITMTILILGYRLYSEPSYADYTAIRVRIVLSSHFKTLDNRQQINVRKLLDLVSTRTIGSIKTPNSILTAPRCTESLI